MPALIARHRRHPVRRTATSSPAAGELDSVAARLAAGEVAAFSELYQATSAQTYGLVLRVLRSPDHAAEVTQEVYLEVWRQVGRYDPTRGSVQTWISVMAHRRAVDRVRSVACSTARDERYALAGRTREIDGVWESVAARSDAALVHRALARLDERQREALTMAYFGGRTQAQIAILLGVPLGTVKTRIRNGLINLRGGLDFGESMPAPRG